MAPQAGGEPAEECIRVGQPGTGASQVLHAHLAADDVCPDEPRLERVGGGRALEALLGDGGEPKAVLVGEVVAGPPAPIALDERCGAEVLQTAAWRHQRLATTFIARGSVLQRRREGQSCEHTSWGQPGQTVTDALSPQLKTTTDIYVNTEHHLQHTLHC